MKKIIFLCHGNICRSPVAEALMKHEIAKNNLEGFEISSAALSSDEIGNTPDIRSLNTLKKLNIHTLVEKHRARQIRKDEFDKFDEFVVMDSQNERQFKQIFGTTSKMRKLLGSKDVADPYYSLDFDKALNEIHQGVKNLLKEYESD